MATTSFKVLHENLIKAVETGVGNKAQFIAALKLICEANARIKYAFKQLREMGKLLLKLCVQVGTYALSHLSVFDSPLVERADGSRSGTISVVDEEGEKCKYAMTIGAGEPKRADGGLMTQDFLKELCAKDPQLVTSKLALSKTGLNASATTDEELASLGLCREDKFTFEEVEDLAA